jgi:GTP-binding protein
MQRAYTYALYGSPPLPQLTSVQARLRAALFNSGGRYLGDEDSLVRGEAPPSPAAAAATAPAAQWAGARSYPWVELAVMGRSNAGKSTLLNALLRPAPHRGGGAQPAGRGSLKSFVPVSKTPGTTARLDFYGVGQAQPPLLVLVDTPGYGYSARGKGRHGAWMARMAEYLRTRRTLSSGPTGSPLLARVMLLADARLGLTDLDHDVLAALDEARLPCHVVLTKADAVRSGEALAATAAAVAAGLRGYKMPFPHLSAVAAETGEGMPELAATLMHTAKLHRLTEADFAAHKAELGLREASAPRA